MANNDRPITTTQIRNFYCQGVSYLNTSFYNTSLSFKFYPPVGPNTPPAPNGIRSQYDYSAMISTTVDFDNAFALYQCSKEILEGKLDEVILRIPRTNGTELVLDRHKNGNQYETVFSISKNGNTIPFIFATTTVDAVENGKHITKTIDSGLGAFNKTIEGYLTGINADRHLNKLTEDYARSKEAGDTISNGPNGQKQFTYNPNNNRSNGGYRNNNNRYNNNGGGYRRYNNNQNNNGGGWNPPKQQDLSSYEIKN